MSKKAKIDTKVTIENGMYGKLVRSNESSEWKFQKVGVAAYIKEIQTNLDDRSQNVVLSYATKDGVMKYRVSRKGWMDSGVWIDAAAKGVDVTKETVGIFVRSLRIQELDPFTWKLQYKNKFSNLGWKKYPIKDFEGNTTGFAECYRHHTLIGDIQGEYEGEFLTKPYGTLDGWKKMIQDEVMGNPLLEFALVASMSALVRGILGRDISNLNPMYHLYGPTTCGKTTAGLLAESVYMKPILGTMDCYNDELDIFEPRCSTFFSWGDTNAANLTSCSGNTGCVVVLDEISKYNDASMDTLLYSFSDGVGKKTKTGEDQTHQSESFSTAIISLGEYSLLNLCKKQNQGLMMRVMEVTAQFTESPESADRIQEGCHKHCGHAAPALAEYILQCGGEKYVTEVFKRFEKELVATWPRTRVSNRFIKTFPALLLTTAALANQALGLSFDLNKMAEFILEHGNLGTGCTTQTDESYADFLDYLKDNLDHFVINQQKNLVAPCYGKYVSVDKIHLNGKRQTGQFLVYPDVLTSWFDGQGDLDFKEHRSGWLAAGYLEREDEKHPTKNLVVESGMKKKRVYVVDVFEEDVQDFLQKTQFSFDQISLPEPQKAHSDQSTIETDAPMVEVSEKAKPVSLLAMQDKEEEHTTPMDAMTEEKTA